MSKKLKFFASTRRLSVIAFAGIVALAALVGIRFATSAMVSTTVEVRADALNGWVYNNSGAGATVTFQGGPSSAPLGNGSARFTVGPTAGGPFSMIRTNAYAGVLLSDLTSLSYKTFSQSGGSGGQAPVLSIRVDWNNDTVADDVLYFEPVYQNGTYSGDPVPNQCIGNPSCVTYGQWQSWDAFVGGFWSSFDGFGGPPLRSLANYVALHPGAKIAGDFPSVRIFAGGGSPPWTNFVGNADDLVIGVSGNDTVYDFEPNAITVNVGSGSLTPTANYTQWFFYNDENDTINNTLGSFVTGPGSAPLGTGSAQISVTGSQRRNLATYQFAGTPLSDITVLKYSTYNPSAGNGGSANRSAYLQFNVDFDGSDTWQRRLLFLPTDNGTVVQNSWQEWDTIGGGSKLWRLSGSTTGNWPGTSTPVATPRTWNDILTSYPGVRIRVSDSWLGMRVGEPYPDGYTENIDKFVFGTGGNVTMFNFDPLPAVVYVDDSWTGSAPGSDPDGAGPATSFGYDAFAKIQDGINGVDGGGTVNVATGTYVEDVNVNKAGVTVSGAGMDSSIIMGPHGVGDVNTVLMGANNVTVQGFTITRTGNTTADWATNNQDQGVNFAQLTTGSTLQNCKMFGNRNGVYMNHTGPHTVRRNVIDNNRTGIQFANDVNGVLVEENFITNNHTLGMVMSFDSPGLTTTGFTVRNNNISGNWYGQVVNRFVNTTADLNFSGNWLGTATPTRTTANSAEPGYPNPHPVIFGGTATPPAPPAHAILGPASAKVDYSPYLNNGGDTQPGTPGFQGDFSSVSVTPDGAHIAPPTSRIQEAIDAMTGGGTLTVPAGTYPGDVNVNKAVHVKGSFTVGGTFTVSNAGAQVSPGTSPGIINSGSLSLTSGSTVNIEINGPNVGSQYDQLNVTGTVSLGNATLNTTLGFTPTAGQVFTIINNDGGDAVTGTFAGLAEGDVFYEGAHSFRISYVGGTGNDVTLTSVVLCNSVNISTAIQTLTGVSVNVPVNVDDTTGKGLYSIDYTLTYDPAVINNPVVSLGTVTAGSVLTVNDTTPGVLIISTFNSSPFTGMGTIANVSFSVPGLPGTSSPVTFSAFKFNEGTQCLSTSNGLVTVIGGTITGTVTYGNALSGPAPPRYVPNVTITGTGPTTVSATTSATNCGTNSTPCGEYSLSGFVAGNYTRSASKTGGIPATAISSFDASRIATHVVGLNPFTGPNQATVADVSGTGGVTSFDASLIARYVVALPGSGSTGNWIFTPTSYGPSTVYANISGEDYTALLMGDVTGNWGSVTAFPGGRPSHDGRPHTPTLTAPTMNARAGMTFTVPVRIEGVVDAGVMSYQFNVRYDPSVIRPTTDPFRIAGTVSDSLLVTVNPEEPGLLRVAVFGVQPISQDGVLANLRFVAVGQAGASTSLTWEDALLNEGEPGHRTVDGRINLTAGPADMDTTGITGRLLTATGEPVAYAAVAVTDSRGVTRTTYADKVGAFRFENVQLGETYTITVAADRYTFAPITVNAVDSLTMVDLIAQP